MGWKPHGRSGRQAARWAHDVETDPREHRQREAHDPVRPGQDIRILVADDDARVRALYVTLLESVPGVDAVVTATDGAEAVEIGQTSAFDLAILDLNMPRLDGVGAARALKERQPALSLLLNSSDPDALRRRANTIDAVLFDKVDSHKVVAWVADEVAARRDARVRDLACVECGYGVVRDGPPDHCPMCARATEWIENDPAGGRMRHHAREAA
jgi:CheY-like chemotaxis protein